MRRIAISFVVCLVTFTIPAATACTFCGGGVFSRQTLREHFAQSKFVAYGQLKNPRFDPNGSKSTTEFHVEQVLKEAHDKIGNQAVLVVPKYIPVIGNTSPDYMMFATVADGKPDPLHGLPATPVLIDYVKAISKLDEKDATKRLAFLFSHLNSATRRLQVMHTSNLRRHPMRISLRPGRFWFQRRCENCSPAHRRRSIGLGVFAMMLGLCGTAEAWRRFNNSCKRLHYPETAHSGKPRRLSGRTHVAGCKNWLDDSRSHQHRCEAPLCGTTLRHRHGAHISTRFDQWKRKPKCSSATGVCSAMPTLPIWPSRTCTAGDTGN